MPTSTPPSSSGSGNRTSGEIVVQETDGLVIDRAESNAGSNGSISLNALDGDLTCLPRVSERLGA